MKDQSIKTALAHTLQWQGAHVSFEEAVKNLSLTHIGDTQHALPYSIWQLTEHIRIAQYDIVSFCLDEHYQERTWPDAYWPEAAAPDSLDIWKNTLQAIQNDRQRMVEAVQDPKADLFAPVSRGNKQQHLFREAMLIVDHEAYHTGQIVLIRKLLGDWQA